MRDTAFQLLDTEVADRELQRVKSMAQNEQPEEGVNLQL
jgi:hypothetical protein